MNSQAQKRPIDNRRLTQELRYNELDLINKLRREAAERSHEMMAEMMDNDDIDRMPQRKRSGFLSRLDEDSTMNESLLSPSRHHQTRRSISRELFGTGSLDTDQRVLSPISNSRPVTRRSISRELYDYNPGSTTSGRITPTFGLTSVTPARRSNLDFSRNSRERSIGLDDFERPTMSDRTRSIGSSRRSESLTRASATPLSSSLTSRPSLSLQGRSLTQSEFSPRANASGRLSTGLEEEPRYRGGNSLLDRGRSDWRRVSAPDRSRDFSSLNSKYRRFSSVMEDSSSNKSFSGPSHTTGYSGRPFTYSSPGLQQSLSSSRLQNSDDFRPSRLSRHFSVDNDHSITKTSRFLPDSYATLSRRNRQPSIVDKYFIPNANTTLAKSASSCSAILNRSSLDEV